MIDPAGSSDEGQAIAALALEFGVPLPEAALAQLRAFVALFVTWNRSINLASVRAGGELVSRHLIDSFVLAGLLEGGVGSAIDVGSGGGLPALPLAVLMTDTLFALCEPNRKKAAFLRTAVRELSLGGRVRVSTDPVEHPVQDPLRAGFDLALSRATFDPASWLALGSELVHPGGRVAVFAAGESGAALPPADVTKRYGEGRRLMLFRR